MKNLPASLISSKNLVNDSGAWVVFADIQLNDDEATKFRLVQNTVDLARLVDVDDYCMAHWKMDETSGTTIADSSGNGNNGTLTNDVVTTEGEVDAGIKIASTGINRLVVPNDSSLNFGLNSYSYCLWLKMETSGVNSQNFYKYGDSKVSFNLYMSNNGRLYAYINDGITSRYTYSKSATLVGDNLWHHIAVVVNRITNIMMMYVDGIPQNPSASIETVGSCDNGNPLYFNFTNNTYTNNYDDVRIYNKILTQEEITLIVSSKSAKYTALYTAFPFSFEPPPYESNASIPSAKLKVCNITRLLQPYIESLGGGIGSQVVISIVHTNNLASDVSELTMMFDVLACESTADFIIFTLGAPNQLRLPFPLYRYVALHCNWKFKSPQCGYTGSDFTTCKRTYEDCLIRENEEKFTGFYGLQNGGVRVV